MAVPKQSTSFSEEDGGGAVGGVTTAQLNAGLANKENLGVAAGLIASESITGSMLAKVEDGDLWAAVAVRGPGTVKGGVIRRATSIQIPWDYTQSVNPTDPAVGTAVNVVWNAVLSQAAGGDGWGPRPATGWFGPRAVFNVEGRVDYATDQSFLRFGPVPFGHLLRIANTPGVPRLLAPGWGFMASPMTLADGAAVAVQGTDTSRGAAMFVDTSAFVSLDGGSLDGVTHLYEHISGLSRPLLSGDVHLARRIAWDVADVNRGGEGFMGGVTTMTEVLRDNDGLATADTGDGEVDENIGVRIQRMSAGGRNIGIENASATVNVPLPHTAAAGTAIPIDASVVTLTNSTGGPLTITAEPAIPDGLDGQELTLVNVSTHPIILKGEALDAGSNVVVPTSPSAPDAVVARMLLEQYKPQTLLFSTAAGGWINKSSERNYQRWSTQAGGASNSYVEIVDVPAGGTAASYQLRVKNTNGTGTAGMTSVAGGTIGIYPTTGGDPAYLHAPVVGDLAVTSPVGLLLSQPGDGVFHGGRKHKVNAQSAAAYTTVLADKAGLITRNNAGASTHVWPQDSAAAIPIGTVIEVVNIGAGTVTHSAGTGATLVTGSKTANAQGTRVTAIKVAANLWSLT